MRLGRAVAPHLQGASEGWPALIGCMRWPVPISNPTHRARIRGAPPILLANATHDPSTPYVWAHGLLDQIPSGVLITREGDGHTSSWLQGRSRTREAIVRYLVTGATPAPNTGYPD
jgi:TAP-like protein